MVIECASCAARSGEAKFFLIKPRGQPRLCWDCLHESQAKAFAEKLARPVLLTRKAWWARRRARDAKPQADLVDLIGDRS